MACASQVVFQRPALFLVQIGTTLAHPARNCSELYPVGRGAVAFGSPVTSYCGPITLGLAPFTEGKLGPGPRGPYLGGAFDKGLGQHAGIGHRSHEVGVPRPAR